MKPCPQYREPKAKKEPIPRISERKTSTILNKLIFFDISTVKKSSTITTIKALTKPNWRLVVDDFSELPFGDFFETKDDMVEPTCEIFHLWEQAGKPVKVIRWTTIERSWH